MKLFYELWQHSNKKNFLLIKFMEASTTPEFINQLFINWQYLHWMKSGAFSKTCFRQLYQVWNYDIHCPTLQTKGPRILHPVNWRASSTIHVTLAVAISRARCTINSKTNGTPEGVYLTISKLHSILAVANLLAHNNLQLCFYGQENSLGKNRVYLRNGQVSTFGVPFILLVMVQWNTGL